MHLILKPGKLALASHLAGTSIALARVYYGNGIWLGLAADGRTFCINTRTREAYEDQRLRLCPDGYVQVLPPSPQEVAEKSRENAEWAAATAMLRAYTKDHAHV